METIYLYINDHESRLNAVGTYQQIKDFTESQTDREFEEFKEINDVTEFSELHQESDLEGLEFTDLRNN